MAYTFDEPKLGMLQIANVDTGVSYTSPAGVTTVSPTPPNVLGMVMRAKDPTFGEGEFILLPGCTGNVLGTLLNYNSVSYTTTANPNTANLAQPVAVSMAANTVTTNFQWCQISGVAVIKKTAVKVNPNVPLYQSGTAGRVMPTAASGKQLLGARSANTATIASATSTINAILDRPHMQGAVA